MIDTNALLSAALVLIQQFHDVVKVPSAFIPKARADIQRAVLGTPMSPVDMFVVGRSGAMYSLEFGAVVRYQTTNSLLNLQDPDVLRQFAGVAKMGTNELLSLAQSVIPRLVKQGHLPTNQPPIVNSAGALNNTPLPIYGVSWPSGRSESRFSAIMEIDARTGEVTYLTLRDHCFRDPIRQLAISNLVCQPDLRSQAMPPRVRLSPFPATNDLTAGIASWLRLCRRMGLQPGSVTNLAGIDWDKTSVFTNQIFSTVKPELQVVFTNGAAFNTLGDRVIALGLPDKYFTSERMRRNLGDEANFVGTVRRRWGDLAREFEHLLRSEFGFPADAITPFEPGFSMGNRDAPLGSRGCVRLVVTWRQWPHVEPKDGETIFTPISQARIGFAVEFDIDSGEIKGFTFQDPHLVELFCEAQAPPK